MKTRHIRTPPRRGPCAPYGAGALGSVGRYSHGLGFEKRRAKSNCAVKRVSLREFFGISSTLAASSARWAKCRSACSAPSNGKRRTKVWRLLAARRDRCAFNPRCCGHPVFPWRKPWGREPASCLVVQSSAGGPCTLFTGADWASYPGGLMCAQTIPRCLAPAGSGRYARNNEHTLTLQFFVCSRRSLHFLSAPGRESVRRADGCHEKRFPQPQDGDGSTG